MEDLDPRLTINNLTGSKGGLEITKAFAHYHDRLFPDNIALRFSLADFENCITAKPKQKLMYYYKAKGVLSSNGNTIDVNFLFQPIRFVPTYDTNIFVIGPYRVKTLYQYPLNGVEDLLINVSNDSIKPSAEGGLGYLYTYFSNFSGVVSDFSVGEDSKIKVFHSSILVENFKGKKIESLNPDWDYQHTYLLEKNKFYYVKVKPWHETTGEDANPDRIWEFVINFPELPNQQIVFGNSVDSQLYSFSKNDENTIQLIGPYQTGGGQEEVYELPLIINNLIFADQSKTISNTSPTFDNNTITWTFSELNNEDVRCSRADVNLKMSDPTYYRGGTPTAAIYKNWDFHYNRSVEFTQTMYSSNEYTITIKRDGSVWSPTQENFSLPYNDTVTYQCILERENNKIRVKVTSGNPNFSAFTTRDKQSCTCVFSGLTPNYYD